MWNSFVKIQHREINHNLYKKKITLQHLQNYCAFTDVRKTGAKWHKWQVSHINNQS
jgi:hypothetical protein